MFLLKDYVREREIVMGALSVTGLLCVGNGRMEWRGRLPACLRPVLGGLER